MIPKIGDVVRMTVDTDWFPAPTEPYEDDEWRAGTSFVVAEVYGSDDVGLRPLRNNQRIVVGSSYMWTHVEPV